MKPWRYKRAKKVRHSSKQQNERKMEMEKKERKTEIKGAVRNEVIRQRREESKSKNKTQKTR